MNQKGVQSFNAAASHEGDQADAPSSSFALPVLVVVVGLVWAGFWLTRTGENAVESAPAPFVYRDVLVFHLLGVIPLAFWCCSWIVRGRSRRGTLRVLGSMMGLAAAPLVTRALPPAIELLTAIVGADLHLFDLMRVVAAIVVVLPWCLVVAAVRAWPNDGRRLLAVDGVIVLLLAYLPVLQVHQVIERKLLVSAEEQRHDQFATELTLCRQLSRLGVATLGENTSMAAYTAELERRVTRVQRAVQTPLPADASDDERLERARRLFQLGEFAKARDVIGDLAKTNPNATVRLGLMSELEGDWSVAAEHYATVLELANSEGGAEQLHLIRLAMERRVNNLRRIGKSLEAERELRQALQRWPAARDAILLQLGYHYKMAGRHHDARDFFQQAAALNPQYQPIVERELSESRNQAEGCIFPAMQ